MVKLPVDLYLNFEKSSRTTTWIFSLQKSISKLIFAGYTGSKNQVKNRLKTQFVKLDFSGLIFQKSSTDQHGVNRIGICMRLLLNTYLKVLLIVWLSHPVWFKKLDTLNIYFHKKTHSGPQIKFSAIIFFKSRDYKIFFFVISEPRGIQLCRMDNATDAQQGLHAHFSSKLYRFAGQFCTFCQNWRG